LLAIFHPSYVFTQSPHRPCGDVLDLSLPCQGPLGAISLMAQNEPAAPDYLRKPPTSLFDHQLLDLSDVLLPLPHGRTPSLFLFGGDRCQSFYVARKMCVTFHGHLDYVWHG